MSLHRFAARRDANEPEIRARFAHHGWHTEALSGTGLPDLLCFPPQSRVSSAVTWLVDVKTPKGGFKPAQVKKWTELRDKGIPVYIARTAEDVDAIVAGRAEAWAPRNPEALPDQPVPIRERLGKPVRRNYTPPHSTPVDAAKEAEATFAPSFQCPHGAACVHGCS